MTSKVDNGIDYEPGIMRLHDQEDISESVHALNEQHFNVNVQFEANIPASSVDETTSSYYSLPKLVPILSYGAFCNVRQVNSSRVVRTDERLNVKQLPNGFQNTLVMSIASVKIIFEKQKSKNESCSSAFRISPLFVMSCKRGIEVQARVTSSEITVGLVTQKFDLKSAVVAYDSSQCPDVSDRFMDIAIIKHRAMSGTRFWIPKIVDLDDLHEYDDCTYPLALISANNTILQDMFFAHNSPYLSFGNLIQSTSQEHDKVDKMIREGHLLQHCAVSNMIGSVAMMNTMDWLTTTNMNVVRNNVPLKSDALRCFGVHIGSADEYIREYEQIAGTKKGTRIQSTPNLIVPVTSPIFAVPYAKALMDTADVIPLERCFPKDDIIDLIAYCRTMTKLLDTNKYKSTVQKFVNILEMLTDSEE
jgi:hypothetical protein